MCPEREVVSGQLGRGGRRQQHQIGRDSLGVRPQVARCFEWHAADQLDGRPEHLDGSVGAEVPCPVEAVFDELGVGAHPVVERELFGERARQPFLAWRRIDETRHRPAGFGDDVRERGVADIELPHRGAGQRARRALPMCGQPRDQLASLRPLEHGGPAVLVDHVDRADQANKQRPRWVGRPGVEGHVRTVAGEVVGNLQGSCRVFDELGDC